MWSVGTLSYTTGGLVVLFLFLLAGDFAWSMKERSVGLLFQTLLKKFEVSDFMSGIMLGTIPAAITLLVSPVVSMWSDRLRTRWGRRIPFLILPTPIIVGSMMGLAFSPVIGPWANALGGGVPGGDRLWIIASFAVFWTIFEVSTIIANSVFHGLVNDVVPQAVIGRFFGMFRMVSLGAGIFFNYSLIGYAETHYVPVFIAIGIIYGVGLVVMCYYVKEGTYPPPAPLPPNTSALASAGRYLRECSAVPFYRWFFITMAIAAATFMPVNLFSFFAAKSFNVSLADFGKYNAIGYICSIVLAFPLGWLTDRYHPVICGGITLIIYAISMLFAYFFITDGWSFGAYFIAHTVLSGCYFTVTASISQRIYPRLKFTQMLSAAGIVNCLLNIVAAPALGKVLDFNGHDYRATYLIGSITGFISLGLWYAFYRRFSALGGVKNYQAPEV